MLTAPSNSVLTLMHGIDPAGYLLAAVRAADRGEALLPWQYAAQR